MVAPDTPQSDNTNDLADRTFGEFRLLRRLGQGGMAEVYLAEQTSLSRYVAVKVLRKELVSGSDDALVKRFEQEARAAAVLNHPHIVQVYTTGQEDSLHYIVQEYVQGRNLNEVVRRSGPPNVTWALRIMEQVADALKTAADAGIVHRDIKPENIMITSAGDAKVADFGLAQLAEVSENLNLTKVGTTMGTPLYMSPEQVNGKKLDQRSDIYSLGVTCYHMLTGKPPFHGETAMSVAVQHLKEPPPQLLDRRADLPRAIGRIVHRMMAKDPGDRYQTAEELLDEIKAVSSGLANGTLDPAESLTGLAAISSSIPTSSSDRMSAWFRDRTNRWLMSACLLVALISAAIGLWKRPQDPFQQPLPAASDQFPREDTARKQFAVALTAGLKNRDGVRQRNSIGRNEEAWKAVVRYFPDTLEAKRAVLQLGYLYLDTGRYSDARRQFKDLETMGVDDDSLRAQGLAGQAITATMSGDAELSRRIIETQLLDLRDKLNESLARRLAEAERRNVEIRRESGT